MTSSWKFRKALPVTYLTAILCYRPYLVGERSNPLITQCRLPSSTSNKAESLTTRCHHKRSNWQLCFLIDIAETLSLIFISPRIEYLASRVRLRYITVIILWRAHERPHNSPKRARYGVSFVSEKSDRSFTIHNCSPVFISYMTAIFR